MSVSDTRVDSTAEPFLSHLLDRACRIDGTERRRNQRHPLSVTLAAQPLDADLKPQGNEFRVITRDVSPGGIGFVHSEPIEQEFLKLIMPDHDGSELVVKVRHCTPVGELGLLYLIGTERVEPTMANALT